MPPENRNLGFVFQDYALFPHLNVFENVGFGLGRKVNDRKIKIQSIIEMIDLKSHEKKYPNQLSGGQQQRVAIGRALAINPSAILMDEPFSNLDFSLKSILSNEVKRIIRNTGTTTIMVTHDEREAERLSDECFLLENGKIRKKVYPSLVLEMYRQATGNPKRPLVIFSTPLGINKVALHPNQMGFILCSLIAVGGRH